MGDSRGISHRFIDLWFYSPYRLPFCAREVDCSLYNKDGEGAAFVKVKTHSRGKLPRKDFYQQ